ncbi:MAG: hypothetical protein ACE5H4_04060 [Candidatus Thorarchaeota archaeon]
MLIELGVIAATLLFMAAMILLARKDESECTESMDECLREWDSIKEGWE